MNTGSAPIGASFSRNKGPIFSLVQILLVCLAHFGISIAAPLSSNGHSSAYLGALAGDTAPPTDDPSLWLYLGVAMILVLAGGAFAGLTIAFVYIALQIESH